MQCLCAERVPCSACLQCCMRVLSSFLVSFLLFSVSSDFLLHVLVMCFFSCVIWFSFLSDFDSRQGRKGSRTRQTDVCRIRTRGTLFRDVYAVPVSPKRHAVILDLRPWDAVGLLWLLALPSNVFDFYSLTHLALAFFLSIYCLSWTLSVALYVHFTFAQYISVYKHLSHMHQRIRVGSRLPQNRVAF